MQSCKVQHYVNIVKHRQCSDSTQNRYAELILSASSPFVRWSRYCTKDTLNNDPTFIYNDVYENIEYRHFQNMIANQSLLHENETEFKWTPKFSKEKWQAVEIQNDKEHTYYKHACKQEFSGNITVNDYINNDKYVPKLGDTLNFVESYDAEFIMSSFHKMKAVLIIMFLYSMFITVSRLTRSTVMHLHTQHTQKQLSVAMQLL